MKTAPERTVPRPFSLHWGKGQVVEEAAHVGEHHQPSLQLLEFEDYYNHAGMFQRSPMILGPDDVSGLRDALAEAPRLRVLLAELVG